MLKLIISLNNDTEYVLNLEEDWEYSIRYGYDKDLDVLVWLASDKETLVSNMSLTNDLNTIRSFSVEDIQNIQLFEILQKYNPITEELEEVTKKIFDANLLDLQYKFTTLTYHAEPEGNTDHLDTGLIFILSFKNLAIENLTLDTIVNLTNNIVTIHENTDDLYGDGTGGKAMPEAPVILENESETIESNNDLENENIEGGNE